MELKLRALLAVGFLFLGGCQICSRDPSTIAHIKRIAELSGTHTDNVCNAEVVDDLDGNYGLAAYIPGIQCDIYIRSNLPPLTFRATIYHEYGHCVGLEHQPSGIMRSHAYDESYYEQNWIQLEREVADLISDY